MSKRASCNKGWTRGKPEESQEGIPGPRGGAIRGGFLEEAASGRKSRVCQSVCSSKHRLCAFSFSLQPKPSPPYSRAPSPHGLRPRKGSRTEDRDLEQSQPTKEPTRAWRGKDRDFSHRREEGWGTGNGVGVGKERKGDVSGWSPVS